MSLNKNNLLASLLLAGGVSFFASCNKDVEEPMPITTAAPTGSSIASLVNNDPNFSILRAAITRASTATSAFGTSLATLLADSTGIFTVFAPTDAAFQASGIPSVAAISTLRPLFLDTILRYHIVGGQRLTSNLIPTTFPNIQEPTQLVLAAPSATLPPGLRLSIFPSKRGNLLWANNIPLTAVDVAASNGVIHRAAAIIAPPSGFLWNRIDTASNLTYLKAAILRADSGVAVTASGSLQGALLNPAANLTVFAPNNTAVQTTLTALITAALIPVVTQQLIPVITQQLIAGGASATDAAAQAPALAAAQAPAIAATQAAALASTPAVFSNPALYGALSAQTVKAIVVYHLLGSRAFLVNIPSTATVTPTLLNAAVPTHPGLTVQATFSGTNPYLATAATVKGIANATASNILFNPTPAPNGSSDQHYVNGVLHVIDQLLRPQ